jgi:nicotinate (nicotinamide) nucleotide adenylyltransferase
MHIGILGGAFDPIHIGHVQMARAALAHGGVDEVWFMPSRIAPLKAGEATFAAATRLKMVEAAIVGEAHMRVSTLELDRPQTSYTIDTVQQLREHYPNDTFSWIIGADRVNDLMQWKSIEALAQQITFIAVHRPGYDLACDVLPAHIRARMTVIQMELIDISSTAIRRRLAAGEAVDAFVPREALPHMQPMQVWTTEAIAAHVEKRMPAKRWAHTQGVIAESIRLAKRYGADPDKAELAATLHDVAKYWSIEEQRHLLIREQIGLDELAFEKALMHAVIGAWVAEHEYGITDVEVLDAIRYHTSGRVQMSLLDKIVCLADYIEPGRDFPGVGAIRKLADEDLNQALVAGFNSTIQFLIETNKRIFPLTLEARNGILAELE